MRFHGFIDKQMISIELNCSWKLWKKKFIELDTIFIEFVGINSKNLQMSSIFIIRSWILNARNWFRNSTWFAFQLTEAVTQWQRALWYSIRLFCSRKFINRLSTLLRHSQCFQFRRINGFKCLLRARQGEKTIEILKKNGRRSVARRWRNMNFLRFQLSFVSLSTARSENCKQKRFLTRVNWLRNSQKTQ